MPFGTSTKERLCTEMNNYPKMRTSDTIFWLSAKESTSCAGGGQLLWITLWTVWIICGHTRFVKAKSAKTLWIILWKLWMLSPNLKRFEGRDTYTADG